MFPFYCHMLCRLGLCFYYGSYHLRSPSLFWHYILHCILSSSVVLGIALFFLVPIYLSLLVGIRFCFYLPRRRRPGTGDIATPPVRPSVRPSVCPSVCPSVRLSVTFSFRTVTQKRIAVFSRNFAGTCTKSWGCAV